MCTWVWGGKPRVSCSITCYLISLCQGLSLNLELGGQPGCPLFPLLWGYMYLWPHLVFIRVSRAYLLSHLPRFSCLVLGIISYFLFRKVFICCLQLWYLLVFKSVAITSACLYGSNVCQFPTWVFQENSHAFSCCACRLNTHLRCTSL